MSQYCSSPALATSLIAVKNIMFLISIAAPIALIIAGTLRFFNLMKNPDEKNGMKKTINAFVAAVIVFFVPMLVNVVLGLVGTNTSISACWKNVKEPKETTEYVSISSDNIKKTITSPDEYEKGNKSTTDQGGEQ